MNKGPDIHGAHYPVPIATATVVLSRGPAMSLQFPAPNLALVRLPLTNTVGENMHVYF